MLLVPVYNEQFKLILKGGNLLLRSTTLNNLKKTNLVHLVT